MFLSTKVCTKLALIICLNETLVAEAKARASFRAPPFPYTGPLRPYYVGPMRSVPDHIQKPDYAETGVPESEKQAKRESSKIPIYTKVRRSPRLPYDAMHGRSALLLAGGD